MLPRVGHIQFLNCMPLYYGLVKKRVLSEVTLIKGTPTELNNMLVEGQLDISPISAFQYGKHYKELELLPGITVSSDGEVQSIFLISKIPINELDGKKVALTNTSATSQNLVKIILKEKYNITPEYFQSPPLLRNMLMEADAALLIGDAAIEACYNKPQGLFFYDLGEEWKAMTGQKMVYAVWAVRRDYAKDNPEAVVKIIKAFNESMEYSVKNAEEIAAEIAKYESYSEEYLINYFRTLEFNFSPCHQNGLSTFYEKLTLLDLLPELPTIKFFNLD